MRHLCFRYHASTFDTTETLRCCTCKRTNLPATSSSLHPGNLAAFAGLNTSAVCIGTHLHAAIYGSQRTAYATAQTEMSFLFRRLHPCHHVIKIPEICSPLFGACAAASPGASLA